GAMTLFSLNNLKAMTAVYAVQIKVNNASVNAPDNTEKLKNSAKFIPPPKEKSKKRISMVSPGRKNTEILAKRFPKIFQILNHKKKEIKKIIGNVVQITPSELSVNNGPSLIASIDKPPTSERLPYVLVKAAYMPLLLFVIAAIMAIV